MMYCIVRKASALLCAYSVVSAVPNLYPVYGIAENTLPVEWRNTNFLEILLPFIISRLYTSVPNEKHNQNLR